MHAQRSTRPAARALAVACVALLLGACSTPRLVPKVDEEQVRQLRDAGYTGAVRGTFTANERNWALPSGSVSFVLREPASAGPWPLIVYLPGIGEPASAGRAWADEWARSGYAVLSVQALQGDAQAWASPAALNGDFVGLGRERFSAKVMGARLGVLRELMAEVQRRREAGDAVLSRVDPSRVAIAGFDLGAYAAVSVAAAQAPGQEGAWPAPFVLVAVVALSPHPGPRAAEADRRGVDRNPGGLPAPALALPVLSITSDEDHDPLGLLNAITLRRQPFDSQPPGDKFLLTLGETTHAVLGGPPIAQLAASNCEAGNAGRDAEMAGRSRGRGAAGARTQAGMDMSPIRSTALCGIAMNPTVQALGVQTAQTVSVAFLDAYLRRDAAAAAWLRRDATSWIGSRGRLEAR